MIKKPKWATSPKSLDLKTPDHRVIVSLLVFLLIISAIVLFNPNNSKVSTIKSYPATVCPGNLSNGTSTSVLPSSKTLVRQIPASKNLLAKAKTTFYLSSKPLFLIYRHSKNAFHLRPLSIRTILARVAPYSLAIPYQQIV